MPELTVLQRVLLTGLAAGIAAATALVPALPVWAQALIATVDAMLAAVGIVPPQHDAQK